MQRQFLFGIAAGLMSMAAFATAASVSAPALLFFIILTPLPIFLAGFSAGWQAATIAGLTGAILMTLVSSPLSGGAFAATQLLPAALLCYLALLYREPLVPTLEEPGDSKPVVSTNPAPDQREPDKREWYPMGWIVLWAVAIAIVLSIITLAVLAPDFGTLKTMLRERLDTFIDTQMPQGTTGKTISDQDRDIMTQVTLYLLPGAITITILSSLLFNMWFAGRLLRAGGYLSRPWPDLSAITYPAGTPLALTLSLIAAWTLEGIPGLAASAAAGGLFFAYVLLGLAIIHHITRGQEWRSFALIGVYLSLIIFNSAFLILIVLIGLAEPISPLRRDFIKTSGGSADNDN